MKTPYVSELQPNQTFTATLLVQQKEIRQKKTGEPYLSMILCDRTGELDARMWDNVAEVMETFERDDFLRVRGLLQVHHNRLQIAVHKLQKQPMETVDYVDFFPSSERNPDEMYAELRAFVSAIGNDYLRSLASAIIEDPAIQQRLRVAPAARNVHHAFLGGLLEHTLSMCVLAKLIGTHYKNIDLDLLMTGVVLHDIGKVSELTYDRTFGYSDDGQLLGHIVMGLQIINDKIRGIEGFPPRLRTLIGHMILSHHGELEYGSPKVPLFPEALLLHHIDNLDSRMECMRALVHKDRQVEGCWTSYNNILERSVLKKARYLNEPVDEPVRVAETRTPPPPAAPRTPHGTVFADKLLGALRSGR
ncbi:MAG: HD domain-containing protein [Bryobacteraceae bacterium]|nr:HD domain-containing protein [Bryobacteraceae bacterium]